MDHHVPKTNLCTAGRQQQLQAFVELIFKFSHQAGERTVFEDWQLDPQLRSVRVDLLQGCAMGAHSRCRLAGRRLRVRNFTPPGVHIRSTAKTDARFRSFRGIATCLPPREVTFQTCLATCATRVSSPGACRGCCWPRSSSGAAPSMSRWRRCSAKAPRSLGEGKQGDNSRESELGGGGSFVVPENS